MQPAGRVAVLARTIGRAAPRGPAGAILDHLPRTGRRYHRPRGRARQTAAPATGFAGYSGRHAECSCRSRCHPHRPPCDLVPDAGGRGIEAMRSAMRRMGGAAWLALLACSAGGTPSNGQSDGEGSPTASPQPLTPPREVASPKQRYSSTPESASLPPSRNSARTARSRCSCVSGEPSSAARNAARSAALRM